MAQITSPHILIISLILFFLFSTQVLGSPVYTDRRRHTSTDYPSFESRQQGGIFSILGVAGLDDQNRTVHPRLEIRELEKHTTQWNVLLLGLQRFQNVSQDDKLSYFQIAGMLEYLLPVIWSIFVACSCIRESFADLVRLFCLTVAAASDNMIYLHRNPWTALGCVGWRRRRFEQCPHRLLRTQQRFIPNLAPSLPRALRSKIPSICIIYRVPDTVQETLYLNAREAISEFPNGTFKDEHMAALTSLRLPYWYVKLRKESPRQSICYNMTVFNELC
jgi:hypothetical protein